MLNSQFRILNRETAALEVEAFFRIGIENWGIEHWSGVHPNRETKK